MIDVMIVIREPGKLKPDYSLQFSLPALPRPGDYLSIQRPDTPKPFSEDAIVERVWWSLAHPEINTIASSPGQSGKLIDIVVECQPAVGPYSSDAWRKSAEHADNAGRPFARLELERFSVRQSDIE